MEKTARDDYFTELAIRLRQAGFTVSPQEDGLLPVGWDGQSLCRIDGGGSIRYRQEDVGELDRKLDCQGAMGLAATTAEYVKLMAEAPDLKVENLGERYKLLANFNGAVLAGQTTKFGIQFVTWEWNYEKTGLWQGHYYGGSYEKAKQDFAVRAGLVDRHRLFTNERLAEIYRCVQKTLDAADHMTPERQIILEEVADQIRYSVSDLSELVSQSARREMEVATDDLYQGMTHQI